MAKWMMAALVWPALWCAEFPSGPTHGALVLDGGGVASRDVQAEFGRLAGGPEATVVLVPSALADEFLTPEWFTRMAEGSRRNFGVARVVVLHAASRSEAEIENFAAVVHSAGGVWFSGGDHRRILALYSGTPLEQELRRLLDRGGVVGGSSAGAMVIGTYQAERSGRKGRSITDRAENWKGFGLLSDSVIDAHAVARNRQEHLWPIVRKHRRLLGLAIDEGTAIIVSGGEFHIIGRGQVVVCDGRKHDGRPYFLMSKGERFDLRTRTRR